MRKIKVVRIIESTGKCGPRFSLCRFIDDVDKEKFEVTLICSTLRDRTFYSDIEGMREHGIKVIILQMKREISPISDMLAFIKLCWYINKGRYDIIHTHNSKAGFLGRLAARFMGAPVVIHTPHCFAFMNESFSKFERRLYFYLERFTGLFTNGLITVSESQRSDLEIRRLIKPEKVFLIENGIDINRFDNGGIDVQKKKKELGLDNNSLILGTVGVLNESKGHKYLIKALSKIIQDGFDAKLIIAGEGPLRRELEGLAQRLGISSKVTFLGHRDDVPEILPIMDVFVFPSLWEGMPHALLEAMAQGLPVISTDVHGAIDVVTNNRTGILVQRRDVNGLIDAIKYLISHREKAHEMGEEARKFIIKNYPIEKQIRETEGLYIRISDQNNHLTVIKL